MAYFTEKLKVGDKVIVSQMYRERISVVEKITPTGLIKVDGILYNKYGRQRGGDFGASYINEATPEAVSRVIEKSTILKAFQLMRSVTNITLTQATQIIEILSKGGADNET